MFCQARVLRAAACRLASIGVLTASLALAAPASAGLVNLELRAPVAWGNAGQIVEVELWAVHDHPTDDQPVSAIDVVFEWDPASLQLIGLDTTEAVPLLVSAFPANDLHQVNESVPPQDGDGYYLAMALPGSGNAIQVSPEGVKITTFRFLVHPPNGVTRVEVAERAGQEPGQFTLVWDGSQVNTTITGTFGAVDLRTGCPADTDGNGAVDVDDLLDAILDWGTDGSLNNSDVTHDGIVNVDDLIAIILSWGPCP
jgi:hypothetical protein